MKDVAMVKRVEGVLPQHLPDRIRVHIPLGGRVLDVGCGFDPCYHDAVTSRCREMVCVDAFEPYLQRAQATWPDQIKQTILGRAQDVLPKIDDYFDIALAIDFIEHLEKPDALFVIEQLKQLAPVVAVFTCLGNHPQDRDWLGNGNDYYQTHRSRWELGELAALGFEEEHWPGFHAWGLDRYANVPDFVPDAIWGVWRQR